MLPHQQHLPPVPSYGHPHQHHLPRQVMTLLPSSSSYGHRLQNLRQYQTLLENIQIVTDEFEDVGATNQQGIRSIRYMSRDEFDDVENMPIDMNLPFHLEDVISPPSLCR